MYLAQSSKVTGKYYALNSHGFFVGGQQLKENKEGWQNLFALPVRRYCTSFLRMIAALRECGSSGEDVSVNAAQF